MKKVILNLFTLLFVVSFSKTLIASEVEGYCGLISTKTLYLHQNEYELKFKGNDGIINHYKVLSPGTHKLRAYIIGQGGRSNSNMTINIGINNIKPTSRVIDFYINIEPNKKYQLVAEKIANPKPGGPASKFTIKIKNIMAQECDPKKIKENETEAENVGDEEYLSQTNLSTLPDNLTYRLGLITKEIKDYFLSQNIKADIISLSQPKRVSDNVGIITNINDNETKGINVISVSPYSIASLLGVKKGDIILSINNQNLANIKIKTQAIQILKNNISNFSDDNDLSVIVQRASKEVSLKIPYSGINIPSYKLQIELNN